MIDRKWPLGGVLLMALASCAAPQGGEVRGPGARLPSVGGQMVSDVPVKIGKPYEVGGVTYTPVDDPLYDEIGQASWYGEELSGNTTANGEIFNPSGVSAAHTTLPLPSYVEVTSLKSGRTILVRVNDRGPFSPDRLIDLSRGAAEQLGIAGQGATPVRVRRVNPPEQEKAKLRAGGRAAERLQAPDALLSALRAKSQATAGRGKGDAGPRLAYTMPDFGPDYGPDIADEAQAVLPASSNGYIVQLAAFASKDRAEKAAKRVDGRLSQQGAIWRVSTGPYKNGDAARRAVQQAAASGFPGAQIVVND